MKVSQVFIALQHCTWNVGVNEYAHSLWYLKVFDLFCPDLCIYLHVQDDQDSEHS